jgi:hypothetical protein
MINICGYNNKNKSKLIYLNLSSAIRPILHGPELPVYVPSETFETISNHDTSIDSDDNPSNNDEDSLQMLHNFSINLN